MSSVTGPITRGRGSTAARCGGSAEASVSRYFFTVRQWHAPSRAIAVRLAPRSFNFGRSRRFFYLIFDNMRWSSSGLAAGLNATEDGTHPGLGLKAELHVRPYAERRNCLYADIGRRRQCYDLTS